jgi:hypothetical protein
MKNINIKNNEALSKTSKWFENMIRARFFCRLYLINIISISGVIFADALFYCSRRIKYQSKLLLFQNKIHNISELLQKQTITKLKKTNV